MKTYKTFFGMAAIALAMPLVIACSDDDDNPSGGGPDKEKPLTAFSKPERNPWLAQEHYSITHFNSAQTDAFPYSVKEGTFRVNIDECQGAAWSGPVNLMTLASTNSQYMWGVSSDRVSYLKVNGGGLERVAQLAHPGSRMKTEDELRRLTAKFNSYEELEQEAKSILGPVPQIALADGNYVLCDKENFVYSNAGKKLARYGLIDKNDPAKGIELVAVLALAPHSFGSETLVGVSMTYDGYLLIGSRRGLVTVDRALQGVVDSYEFPADQILSNSMAIEGDGGVYVASNSTEPGGKGVMFKLICKNGKFSDKEADGAWKATYDGGPKAPAIKVGYGTGSTPTLMGFGKNEDRLVVITDGAKRMKLTAFWRDKIPADAKVIDKDNPRLAGQIDVTCGLPASTEWIQSEQSVVVGGYDAFVVNNITTTGEALSDKIVGVLAVGPVVEAPKGVECFRWNAQDNQWESRWTRRDISSVSMIPALSLPSEMVFVNGYGQDGWDVTGLDWRTGQTRHRVIFGDNNRGNGAYAILQYFPNGDLLFNSVSGPFRVKL